MIRTRTQAFGLFFCSLLFGCSDREGALGGEQAAIVNGGPVADNSSDVVRLTLTFPTGEPALGSGVIWENGGSEATIVTASHVLLGGLSKLERPTAITVDREDDGSIVETQNGTASILHPAVHSRFATGAGTKEEPVSAFDWLDVGVVFTPPFETARNLVEPISVDPVLLSGSSVEQFGYGPTVEGDTSTQGELHSFVGVMDGFPMRARGIPVEQVGTAVKVTDPTGVAFSDHGDSGGPVFLAGTHDLVSLHLARNRKPPSKVCEGVGITSVTDWVEAVRITGGKVVTGKFSNLRVPDQLLVMPGSNWIIHVERSDGRRVVHNVTAGPGLGGLQAVAAISKGRFDSGPLEDGLVALQVTGGQQLVQILNPGDASVTPALTLLSSRTYTSFSVKRVNGDGLDDVVAERAGGGQDIFFGSPSGLVSQFGALNNLSCLNAGSHRANACGSDNADGSCSCSTACSTGGGSNCCADAFLVCSGVFQDELITDISNLSVRPPVAPAASGGDQPLVRIQSSVGSGVGLLLNRSWVLAPLALATGSGLSLSQQTDSGQQPLAVQSVVQHPDAPAALIRLTGASSPVVPSDFQVPFFTGGPSLLGDEPRLDAFGRNPPDALFSDVAFPGAAVLSLNQDELGVEFGYDLIQTPSQVSPALALAPGSPIMAGGALVSMTLSSSTETIRQPSGNQQVTLHSQLPFVAINSIPDDDRTSARYFIQQTLARDTLRDFDADGLQDLWVFQQPTAQFFPSLLALPFTQQGVAGAGVPFGPAQGDDGNWRFVGRAKVGESTLAVVWQELDTGDIQIWKLDNSLNIADSIHFNIAPPWRLRALDDINGDGIADWIWSNPIFNTSFFWLMRDVDKFDFADLSAKPADMIKYGQWFNGMPLNEVSDVATFELVGADHFASPKLGITNQPASGPEQMATDLIWQSVGDETTAEIWSMALVNRTCDEIVDALILADCLAHGESVLTYEMSRNVGVVSRPSHFHVAGTADFNADGRPDLVWHAQPGAPAADAGHVLLSLSNANEGFDDVTVTRNGQALVIDSSEGLEVSVR